MVVFEILDLLVLVLPKRFIIVPIVFLMGFSGLVAVSKNSNVIPDLAFFSLLLNKQSVKRPHTKL